VVSLSIIYITFVDQLSNEIVKLTIENTSLRPLADRLTQLETQYEELKERHQTTLIILGEKSERIEELQHDIDDMKEAYREQLQELLQRLGE
jgi:DnaJ-domain-containing protein 1